MTDYDALVVGGGQSGLAADLHVNTRVTAVAHTDGVFTVHTTTGTVTAPRMVAATGGFGAPHLPILTGQDSFAGELVHAGSYRSPADYSGQSVVVVGAGNSAVQIAAELADVADEVVLATGYSPHLSYLAGLGALTDTGRPRHRAGLSTTHSGLDYLGLECPRSLSSASLRGVGRDARHLVGWIARVRST